MGDMTQERLTKYSALKIEIAYIEKNACGEPNAADLIEADKAEMAAVEAAVASIPDIMERLVLRSRYINGVDGKPLKWSEVALQVYGDNDDRQVQMCYSLHRKAMKRIKKSHP